MSDFGVQIADALSHGLEATPPTITGTGSLPSYFDVSGLARASVSAAAGELAALNDAKQVVVHARHTMQWFDMTLRPVGWDLPAAWDAIAGDYAASDGWIKLHTNAPHHRAAALAVLGCPADRKSVADCVAQWTAADLEQAIVAQGGCAAELRGLDAWAQHPQGRAVSSEPLIHWAERTVEKPTPLSLDRLRVLDLTRVLAGPVATRFLAGFGADVLRIDPPAWNEPAVEQEVTLGKTCAGLDLKNAGDRETFQTLLESADVLVHGYRPGALDDLGFDAETRLLLNPTLIDVSLNAYGWTGPWSGRRGFDSLVQMSSGIAATGMEQSGNERPTPLPVQALDHATGYLMAAAILRALRVRASTGRSLQARLSLARTAQLLVSGGVQPLSDALEPETPADLGHEIEDTGWGPAKRVAFPVTLDGQPPQWRHPAGQLRRHAAAWAMR